MTRTYFDNENKYGIICTIRKLSYLGKMHLEKFGISVGVVLRKYTEQKTNK